MTHWIEITNGTLTAAINPHGAELSSLKDKDGRELMTDADPAFWTGRAPILFPIVGAAFRDTIHVDGTAYPIGKHGFARLTRFELIEREPARVVFALTDGDGTRKHYPFAFRLEIAFTLEGATLSIDARIGNPADTPLLASFGFHPAFAWPLPYGHDKLDHRITFAADEPGRLSEIAPDGTIAADTRSSPLTARVLHLRDELFTDDALVWPAVQSDQVTYGAPAGPRLVIRFPDTPMLGVWTKPGAHYVCIEPWHGIADPESFTGDFRDKPGVFEIAPHSEKRVGISVTLDAEP